MTAQILVNGVAVLCIAALGGAAMWLHIAEASQIALASVSTLGGFIGGVGAAHVAASLKPPAPASDPA